MTLTERKGNIRGREFPTDTGIDGNACEETAKDQRWVGLCRQIPDTDTRPTSLSLFLSLSFFLSPLTFPSVHLPRSLASPLVTDVSVVSVHSSVQFVRPHTRISRNTHCHNPPHDVPRISTGWESVRAPFPVKMTAAADIAPRPPSLTVRCLMIPGTSKSTRPIPIR